MRDAVEHARMMAAARWGDTVLQRSAGVVLERAELSDGTRAELEQLIADPSAEDGDE